MRLLRFAIGRSLIHAGLKVMPRGKVRDELYNILASWGHRVHVAVTGNAP